MASKARYSCFGGFAPPVTQVFFCVPQEPFGDPLPPYPHVDAFYRRPPPPVDLPPPFVQAVFTNAKPATPCPETGPPQAPDLACFRPRRGQGFSGSDHCGSSPGRPPCLAGAQNHKAGQPVSGPVSDAPRQQPKDAAKFTALPHEPQPQKTPEPLPAESCACEPGKGKTEESLAGPCEQVAADEPPPEACKAVEPEVQRSTRAVTSTWTVVGKGRRSAIPPPSQQAGGPKPTKVAVVRADLEPPQAAAGQKRGKPGRSQNAAEKTGVDDPKAHKEKPAAPRATIPPKPPANPIAVVAAPKQEQEHATVKPPADPVPFIIGPKQQAAKVKPPADPATVVVAPKQEQAAAVDPPRPIPAPEQPTPEAAPGHITVRLKPHARGEAADAVRTAEHADTTTTTVKARRKKNRSKGATGPARDRPHGDQAQGQGAHVGVDLGEFLSSVARTKLGRLNSQPANANDEHADVDVARALTNSETPKELCARLAVLLGGAQKAGNRLLEIEHGLALAKAYRRWALAEPCPATEARCLANSASFVERSLAIMVQEASTDALPDVVCITTDRAADLMTVCPLGARRLLLHALNLAGQIRPALRKLWRANVLLLLAKCPDDEARGSHPRTRLEWAQRSFEEAGCDQATAARAALFMGDVCAVMNHLCVAHKHYEAVLRWWQNSLAGSTTAGPGTMLGMWDAGLALAWRLSWVGTRTRNTGLMIQASEVGIQAARAGMDVGLQAMQASIDHRAPPNRRLALALPEALHLVRFELLRCLAKGSALAEGTCEMLQEVAGWLREGPYRGTVVDRKGFFNDPLENEPGWFPRVRPRDVLGDRWANTTAAMHWRGLLRTAALVKGCPEDVVRVAGLCMPAEEEDTELFVDGSD